MVPATCSKLRLNFQSMLRDMFWGYLNAPQNALATPLRSGIRRSQARTVSSIYKTKNSIF